MEPFLSFLYCAAFIFVVFGPEMILASLIAYVYYLITGDGVTSHVIWKFWFIRGFIATILVYGVLLPIIYHLIKEKMEDDSERLFWGIIMGFGGLVALGLGFYLAAHLWLTQLNSLRLTTAAMLLYLALMVKMILPNEEVRKIWEKGKNLWGTIK